MKPLRVFLSCVAASSMPLFGQTAGAAGKAGSHAHEHGVVKMDVVIDKGLVQIQVSSPLDSVLGFERAPRNDKERRAAADVLAKLRSGAGLFVLDAAAQCQSAKTEIMAAPFEASQNKAGAGATAATAAKDEHADLEASFEFICQQPQLLRNLDLGWFDAFPRTQRIDVQLVGPKGQSRVTLKRNARSFKLVR